MPAGVPKRTRGRQKARRRAQTCARASEQANCQIGCQIAFSTENFFFFFHTFALLHIIGIEMKALEGDFRQVEIALKMAKNYTDCNNSSGLFSIGHKVRLTVVYRSYPLASCLLMKNGICQDKIPFCCFTTTSKG